MHQFVVDLTDIIFGSDGKSSLKEYISRIKFVLEAEGRHARLLLATDDRPVDGRCSSVAGQ